MKKLLLIALAICLALPLAACDAEVSSTGTTKTDGAAPAEEAKTEFALGEGIKVDDAVMTVVSGKQFASPNEYEKPSAGMVFYIVNIKIENGGEEALDYNEYNYKIQDANGVQKDAAFVTEIPNQMSSGSLAPGGKLDSNIVFEVPQDMKGLKLVMEPNFFSTQQITIVLTP